MIFGDRLIITKKGIYVNNETLATIGIQPGDKINLLPFRTFEYRKKEPGSQIRTDLLITPIPPEKWPFVIRFVLRLRNLPGNLLNALKFLKKNNINIIFEECSHSGHHHSVLNILAEIKELEAIKINILMKEIVEWIKNRKNNLVPIYTDLIERRGQFDDRTKEIIEYYYEDKFEKKSSKKHHWFDGRKPLSYHAFEKFNEIVAANETEELHENENAIKKWEYEPIMEQVEEEIINKQLDLEKGYEEKKLRIKNQIINEKVGEYLVSKFKESRDCTLQDFLEREIKDMQPKIEELEKTYHTNAEKLYRQVEFKILPIKILLQAIIIYKRFLVEKYKVMIIYDSLSDKSITDKIELEIKHNDEYYENRKVDQIPEDVYLYNIRYYDMIIKYPYLMSEKLIINATHHDDEWLKVHKEIIKRLDKLIQDRDKLGKIETRLDLDPVIITTVESLSHAAYHRAFMQHYECDSETSMIKFPVKFDFAKIFMINTLDLTGDDRSSTLAIGSRDTDSNSLRLSPLPIDSLSRFREIEFEYERKCLDQCELNGLKEFQGKQSWNTFIKEMPKEKKEEPENSSICRGTTMGIAHLFANAIYRFESKDVSNPHYLNIWRIYNKTIETQKNYERGSIIAIVQAVGDNFPGFPKDWNKSIEERLKNSISDKFTHQHVFFKKLSIRELSAGKVFVSLPFDHPRRNEWLHKVKMIGKKSGFHEINTIDTHTEPVTKKVAEYIKNCDAMIQILAVDIKINRESSEYMNRFIWLMAEYLAAMSNGLEVIRLIDTDSLLESEIRLGKDHPSLMFRISDPAEKFDEVVEAAFKELREKLSDKLGLK